MTARLGPRLWLGLAIVLAVAGGRFGRRAAGRGLLGLGAALVVSPRRHRNAAAAFAFASGAATELPVVALPLGAAAVAVVATGNGTRAGHEAIIGGAAGVALGIATRRVWPVAPHEPAGARTAPATGTELTTPEQSRVVVVVNQAAGSSFSGTSADRIRALVPSAEVIVVEEPGDWDAAWQRAAEGDVVGVCGGDGTVNQAAAVAHAAGKPLLVFPGGTLNHFGKALGIESLEDAAAALDHGRAIGVDVGVVAGRVFVNVASVGAYVELVEMREQLEGRIGKWPAVLIALGRALRRVEPLDVELDGRRRRIWMAFIGNCRYHPAGFAPSWRERLDDEQLDVRLVDATSPFSRTRLVLAVLTGLLGRSRVYRAYAVDRLAVRSCQGPLGIAVDGELFDGPDEFTFAKAERQLTVLVPV